MTNFTFYTPTLVEFGKGAEEKTGALCAAQGAKKVLVHYGGASALASGLLDKVYASLTAAGIAYVSLGGVKPNPRLSLVYEGIKLGREEKVDFVLAVGGGSVIDSAKVIAFGLAGDFDVWEMFTGKVYPTVRLPMGAVLTIAAAGSEMSNSMVITNDLEAVYDKRGYNHEPLGRVQFAIMNPEWTLSVPAYHTAAGCADIIMHTLERYFTNTTETMELTDGIAESLLHTVITNSSILAREPANYDARAEVMWAGALSHNGLTGCGNGSGDWAVHQLGHELSAKYDLSHGASLTSVWGSWARYVYKNDAARFARLGEHVLGLHREAGQDDEAMALAAIEEMEEFFWAIEMPTSIKEAGFTPTDEEIHALAVACGRNGTRAEIGGLKKLNEADMEKIYQMAKG